MPTYATIMETIEEVVRDTAEATGARYVRRVMHYKFIGTHHLETAGGVPVEVFFYIHSSEYDRVQQDVKVLGITLRHDARTDEMVSKQLRHTLWTVLSGLSVN